MARECHPPLSSHPISLFPRPPLPSPLSFTLQVGSTLEVITWNGRDRKFCDIVETGTPTFAAAVTPADVDTAVDQSSMSAEATLVRPRDPNSSPHLAFRVFARVKPGTY